jgi:hypothetical protein
MLFSRIVTAFAILMISAGCAMTTQAQERSLYPEAGRLRRTGGGHRRLHRPAIERSSFCSFFFRVQSRLENPPPPAPRGAIVRDGRTLYLYGSYDEDHSYGLGHHRC